MNLNWNKAKQLFQTTVSQNGTWIQWLQRSTDRTDAFNTSSSITYGYGDSQVNWTTGSIKAIVQHISATDIVIEPGFYEDSYEKIYIDPDIDINQWDQVIVPSGSGIRFIILSRHIWRLSGDIIVSKYALIRKLVPSSGSHY